MRSLKLAVLMILLTGTAAAQGSPTSADAPGVTVLNISWRYVPPHNPIVNDARVFASPDAAARRAVNTARINQNKSLRQQGIDSPAPVLLEFTSTPDPIPVVRPWSGYVYEITVKNNGAKRIRQLVFNYSYTDARTQVTVVREYKSNVKIRPGTVAKLVVHTQMRPMGTIDASQAGANRPDLSPDQIVIKRLKYDDGSVWQRWAK